MPVTLSIKNAPDDVVSNLRRRAQRNRRSLQGELLAIVEAAAREEQPAGVAAVLAHVRALGLATPADGVAIVRAARDGR